MNALVLYFEDEAEEAKRFAQASGVPAQQVQRHRFPDGELKLTLPTPLPNKAYVYRSLVNPNEKLVELLLVARTSKQLGVDDLILVSPYLAYMRQDIAFHEGEVVSQQVVGQFLASLFDGVVTVDPHLHRIDKLEQAVNVPRPIALSGAPLLGEYIATRIDNAFLLGPDGESAQWVAQAAKTHVLDHAACEKVRYGDKQVEIKLPDCDFKNRHVVLVDDVASSGRTLAKAARLVLAQGASTVDVAVTHALFADDALQVIQAAGVRHVWSTNCISHSSNVIDIAKILAEALTK